jgi:glycosyltransferase involved in cell wall biosynthesis
MAEALPVVCIFGALQIELHSFKRVPHYEATRLDCRCYLTDDNLYEVLGKDRPSVIISFGNAGEFQNLMKAPWSVRKKWLNFDNTNNLEEAGEKAFQCYLHNATEKRDNIPLVTVFTPAYKTGEKIMRPFDSLKNQTHSNWEWVIVDDSDDDGETFEMLSRMAETDPRIRVYKEYRHSGCIGSLKKDACLLGKGEFLVELDHDDELTPRALELVSKAFQKHPECGFVYTDFAECFEDGSPVSYGKDRTKKPPFADWGLGYGSYREETHGGQNYMVANSPNINAKTIRHIVAAPNHIRAWRKSTYLEMGGHGDIIHVADDYELMVRTFLSTRMCRVPEMCYVQYRNFGVGNTHQSRNQEIQRLVRYFSGIYDKRIHERLLELGVDDFVWQEGKVTFNEMGQIVNTPVESHCTIIYKEN